MTVEAERVQVDVRIVGKTTGTIYSEGTMEIQSEQKGPEIYLGDCYMSVPWHPNEVGEDGPPLDPEDKQLKLQFRANAEHTRIGRSEVPNFFYIGHWLGSITILPNGEIELPHGFIS